MMDINLKELLKFISANLVCQTIRKTPTLSWLIFLRGKLDIFTGIFDPLS
jgi:hypothetical protein